MRRDLHIDNEAKSFLLHAAGGGAPNAREISRKLQQFLADGRAALMELVQDDSFNVRFVTGELTDQERAEWVGLVEWNLRIPSGTLALAAGFGPDKDEAAHGACCVEVEPGDYRVAVYAYFPGVTPGGLLVSLKPKDKLSISASIRELERTLALLADETTLECVWGDYAGMNDAGNQRYRGVIRNGVWAVDATYPPMHGDVLREAVEFAANLDSGCLNAKDPQEAERFLRLFQKAMPDWAAAVKPRVDGAILRLGMDDPGELWNAARLAFALRYSGTWAAWAWWEEMFPGERPWESL